MMPLLSTITDPKGTRSRTSARLWTSIPPMPWIGTSPAPPLSGEPKLAMSTATILAEAGRVHHGTSRIVTDLNELCGLLSESLNQLYRRSVVKSVTVPLLCVLCSGGRDRGEPRGRPRPRRGGDWRRVEQLPRDGLPGLGGDIAREGTEVYVERHLRHGGAKRSRVAQEAPVHDTPEVPPRLAREPQPGDHHIYARRRPCRGRAEAVVCPGYDFSRALKRERGRASRLLVRGAR